MAEARRRRPRWRLLRRRAALLRGLWRTRDLRWRRAQFEAKGWPAHASGLMSTLDELIENEMEEAGVAGGDIRRWRPL
jgi:hypothetical protein